MIKVFEIPVYAISREELSKRIKKEKLKITNNTGELRNDLLDIVFNERIYPHTAYCNHIIGFIVVGISCHDIKIERFIPHETIQRYRWNTNRVINFINSNETGLHFRITNMSNTEIVERLDAMLSELARAHYKTSNYIDLQTYNAIKHMIDYKALCESQDPLN